MNKIDYAALRLDPRWQKKRLEVMERDEFKCVDCDDAEKTLNVHHSYYVTGRMPWDYPMFALVTLCRDCHKERHNPRTPDPDEITSTLSEWEIELDWILNGNPRNAGAFWYLAVTLSKLGKKYGAAKIYKSVEALIREEDGE